MVTAGCEKCISVVSRIQERSKLYRGAHRDELHVENNRPQIIIHSKAESKESAIGNR